jgi:hypothetical protein
MEPEGLFQCSQEPSPGPYPGQCTQFTTSHPIYPKIHWSIILTSKPRFSEQSPPFRFPTNVSYPFLTSYILLRVQVMKLIIIIIQFSPTSLYLFL